MFGGGVMMGGGMWLFWGLLLVVIIFVVKALGGFGALSSSSGQPEKAPEKAIEILKARYARGEIDEQEFQRMRSELEK